MIFTEKEIFLARLQSAQKLLGLDVGGSSIGLALVDLKMKLPTPLKTIRRKKLVADIAELKKIISEYNVSGLVIGLPLNMDGSEGAKCQSTRQFSRNILKYFSIPIIFEDERLSTFAAEDELQEQGFNSKKIRIANDMVAAQIILQRFLEKI